MLFKRYDKDKSGELDFNEFKTAIRKGGRISQCENDEFWMKNETFCI